MIELLREVIPEELAWNVLNYMTHPCVDIINQHFNIINNLRRCHENSILFNGKIIFHTFPNLNMLFVFSLSKHN